MSCRNFLTCLILTNRDIPLEYKLMMCLVKVFAIFSPFSFSSHCLYKAYVLLIVSSLPLSSLSCVHLLPNKYALPLPMTLFKHSCFSCCSMPFYGVSKKSSSFNIFSTSVIAFIKGWNRHHMKNNIRYKGNTNNASVIIFVNRKPTQQKLPAMVLCSGKLQGDFCCSCSFIFVLHFVVVVLHFISRLPCHATGTPLWLLRPVKASTSFELYPDYFWLPLVFHLPRALQF